jgi:CPA2 family monovalent cation:H+ antiporter-2
VVRTRFKAGREDLMHAGATEVVVEEVEASVEVMSRLLRRLEVPRNVIAEHVRATREEMQTSLRRFTLPRASFAEHEALSEWKIDSMQISAASHGLGRSPLEMDIRRVTGALIVAVRRGPSILENPDPSQPFEDGDVVYLVGTSSAIRNAVYLMDAGIVPPSPV